VKKLVLESLETPEGDRCVDIFQRGDDSFGFEIYRRDTEALTGWFAIGGYADKPYSSEDEAREAAAGVAPWMNSN